MYVFLLFIDIFFRKAIMHLYKYLLFIDTFFEKRTYTSIFIINFLLSGFASLIIKYEMLLESSFIFTNFIILALKNSFIILYILKLLYYYYILRKNV